MGPGNGSPSLPLVSCNSCRFMQERSDSLTLGKVAMVCRRSPPRPTLLVDRQGAVQVLTMWPVVSAKDWCGEYAPTLVNVEQPA